MSAPASTSGKSASGKSVLRRALFFFLIVLPGMFLAYYSYHRVRELLDSGLEERKSSIASLSANITQERLDHILKLGTTYIARPSVRNMVAAGNWQGAITVLKEIEAYSPHINRIILTDKSGTLRADYPALPQFYGRNFAYREWYTGLVANNWQPHISKAYRRLAPPTINVVNAGFAIRDQQNQVVGILLIQMNLEQFNIWAHVKDLDQGENIYVVDHAGQLVSSPGINTSNQIISYTKFPAVAKVITGKRGVEKMYDPLSKTEVLAAYAPVPGFNWGVVVAQPVNLAYTDRDKSLTAILVIFGLTVVVNLFFAWLIIRNINKLRTAREKLKVSEERYALALQGSNDGLWDWNVRTNEVFFSERWKSMLGYTDAELPNNFDAWQAQLHPEDTNRALQTLQDYFAKKFPVYELEYRLRHKDGSYRWILTRGMALWDEAGKPYRMVGSHTDLTQRKKLEEQQRETQTFLNSIIENIPSMIFVKEARDLRFVRFNKAAEEITGLKDEEVLGKNDYDFFPKEQANAFVNKDREVLASGEMLEIEEEEIKTRYKGTRILCTKKIPIYGPNGEPQYLLGLSDDITEKKKAQAQIYDLNTKLAHQVKQLEETNQELKDVTHIISHDLKAPLRGIEMLGEWLLDDCAEELAENCRNNIVSMNQRVKRMHNLIEGILRYAHIGRTAGQKEELNLTNLVTEITELLAPPENIEIKVETALPKLLAEKAPIQQLFQNLISNAVKYSDKPQGLIKVGATLEGKFWQFYVADNGPGIEEEYFQRIFQLFQTLQARDEFESTGIGLTIVKKIVENFGGKIWLRSELGKGTTFYFTLPQQMALPPAT